MDAAGVSGHDAKLRSGRSTKNGDKSRGAYLKMQDERQFALSCVVQTPRVMAKISNPAPQKPIPPGMRSLLRSG